MSTDPIRTLAGRLNGSVLAVGALGAALRARDSGIALVPALEAAIDEVLEAVGAKTLIQDADPALLQALVAEIQVTVLQVAHLLTAEMPEPGWSPTDSKLLSAAGKVSAGFSFTLQRLAPSLDGLAERLASPGASFLDVGVGVGCLSIGMARLWPSLRIVGIDSWAPSIALARKNVAEAGLEARIELREQAAQDLPDRNTFDLCWVPSAFIRPDVIPAIIERMYAALRPRGWILFGAVNPGADSLTSALARFRTALMGGSLLDPVYVASTLNQAGFADVRSLPSPPHSIAVITAGHRADG